MAVGGQGESPSAGRQLATVGLFFACLALQVSTVNALPFFRLGIDWMLLFTVGFAILYGPVRGAVCGLIAGGFVDYFAAGSMHALTQGAIGLAVGLACKMVLPRNYLLVALIALLASLASELLHAAILSWPTPPPPVFPGEPPARALHLFAWADFAFLVLPVALGHALAALPLFAALKRLSRPD